MTVEQKLRSALQQQTDGWEAPDTILGQIAAQIESDRTAGRSFYAARRRRPIRKRILVTALAAALLLPTGAYAGYHYLADAVYGSKGDFGGGLNAYEQLEAKLQTMRPQMKESEYDHLTGLLREAAGLYSQHVGANGQLEKNKMSAEELKRFETLEREIKEATAGLNTVKDTEAQANESFDVDDFWAEVFEQAKKQFTLEEYAEFEKLAEKERAQGKETDETTMEQLNSYLLRIGYKIEHSK